MPRHVRIEYEGAIYHVMCRGDRREAIFDDDEDRRGFLKTLGQAIGKTGWLVHHGAEVREHGEAEARRMIANWLEEEGLRRKDLGILAKSDARKVRIARAIRRSTGVPLKMLAEELEMGTPMNVSRLTSENR